MAPFNPLILSLDKNGFIKHALPHYLSTDKPSYKFFECRLPLDLMFGGTSLEWATMTANVGLF